jgi:hypothetical protein
MENRRKKKYHFLSSIIKLQEINRLKKKHSNWVHNSLSIKIIRQLTRNNRLLLINSTYDDDMPYIIILLLSLLLL